METLTFRPESFEFEQYEGPSTGGCGCTQCRQQEFDDNEFDDNEFDDNEWEWETNKRAKCSADTPSEVEECGSEKEKSPIQCGKGMTKKCPALPETWKSKTIGGVKFFYEPTIVERRGGIHHVTNEGDGTRQVNLVPAAWRAAQAWISNMNGVWGLPIVAVYHSGAGRYCRCVRQPKDLCKEGDSKNWDKCTGTTISDHGFGDALDIVGVKWRDPSVVGSSLPHTVIHNWADPNQAKLLIRMNAAMRLVFNTVLDYSRSDHRNHFHCDMNHGNARPLWGTGAEKPCERNFIMSSLKRLNYLPATKPITWDRMRDALVDFAQVNKMTAPSNINDMRAWRPVANRLFACVALGLPANCAKP